MRLLSISLLFLLASAGRIIAQPSDYRLETFGTRDGMLSSKIYSLAQAKDRKLWIGTELGVCIFDGYRFINYQYTSTHESIGRILCIAQDNDQNVWLGGDKGLFFFKNDSVHKMNIKGRPTIAVEALLTDNAGNLFIGELYALYKLTTAQVSSVAKKINGPLDAMVFTGFTKRSFSIAIDRQQNLYVGTYDGVFYFPFNQNKHSLLWENPDPYNQVLSVSAFSPDSVYWNTTNVQPYQMIRGRITHFKQFDLIGRSVFLNKQHAYALTTSGVAEIKNESLQPIVTTDRITNNAIIGMIDAEGNIWIGSWEGLLKYRKIPFHQYSLRGDYTEIFSMLERNNGDLLFGSNHGEVFIRQNGLLQRYNAIPKLFPNAEVMCMTETGDNAIWIGSGYQGIARFKNNKVTNWELGPALKDENCEMLYPTLDGKLLACTEQGVTVIDPTIDTAMMRHIPFAKKYTRYPELFGAFTTTTSPYWFYGSQGLYRLKNDQLIDDTIVNMPVLSLYINKIIPDKNKNVWVATQG
ncbi:MAG TPA: hypothetical protein VHM26_13575, partial [Chitinophagaceae bacterium]|nr:hypothetical protein [Chitinophagaceae bacterium]